MVGKRAQKYGVDQAEDGGVGADAECQHEDGGKREARRFAQNAQAVEEVPSHGGLDAADGAWLAAPGVDRLAGAKAGTVDRGSTGSLTER